MKTYEVRLSPLDAEFYLKNMIEYNRPSSEIVVAKYAKDMVEGRWLATGDTIKFRAGDRKIIDGGHRLRALASLKDSNPNIRVPFVLAEDVDPESFKVCDLHKNRNLKETVYMETAGRYSGASSAIAMAHWRYSNGNPILNTSAHAPNPTRAEVIDWWLKDADGYEAAMKRGKDAAKFALGKWYVHGLMYYILSHEPAIGQADADAFYDLVVSGANMPVTHPVMQFRQRMLMRANRSQTTDKRVRPYNNGEQLFLLHRTWKAYCTDDGTNVMLTRHALNNATFPKLYTPKDDAK